MADVIIMVSFHGYCVHIYQWEAEIVALLFLKCKFGVYDML